MTGKHHLVAGVVTGSCICCSMLLSHCDWFIVSCTTVATVFGSLIPGLDTSTSKLGKRVKIASKIINKLFGHRGFLHSPAFVVLMYFLIKYIFEQCHIVQYSQIYYGFLLGIITHLVCDMTTKGGIPLLYPFQKTTFSISCTKSGGKMEQCLLVLLCVMITTVTVIMCLYGIFLPVPS